MPIPSSYSVTLHKLIEYCLTKDHIKRKSVAELLEDPGKHQIYPQRLLTNHPNPSFASRNAGEEQTSWTRDDS